MQIQFLNGGLANQVFQYIFARFAELNNPSGTQWLIDDSFFFTNHVHNGYELESVFGIKANLLSRHFDEEVWQELLINKRLGISIAQSFKNLGFDVQMIAEAPNYKELNPFDGKIYRIPLNEFHPEITEFPGDITYYHGYWLNPGWYRAYREILKKELSFPPITDSVNLQYANLITSSYSIGIHIRRGDYVTIGWDLPSSYYHDTMLSLATEYPNAVFFVFSDDIEWCKNNPRLGFDLVSRLIYVEGNINGMNYRDLQLLSMCKGMVLSNSAFCHLAAIFNDHVDFCIQPPG